MARYIDADALSIYFDALIKHAEMEGLYNMAHVYERCLRIVKDAPTADVAPRAEVEKLQEVNADLNESLRLASELNKDLQAKVDRWRFGLEAVLEERAEDRAEVAREIFEEIEKHLFVIAPIEEFDGWARIQLADIMRLKKKYTQSEPPKGD
jgi:DNA-binding transcriptional regulator YbjK